MDSIEEKYKMEEPSTDVNPLLSTDDQRLTETNKTSIEKNYSEDYETQFNYGYEGVKVKVEDLSPVHDPLGDYSFVDANMDIKDELENNLLRASSSELYTAEMKDVKPVVPEIITSEVHSSTVNTIENISTNTSSSEPEGLDTQAGVRIVDKIYPMGSRVRNSMVP